MVDLHHGANAPAQYPEMGMLSFNPPAMLRPARYIHARLTLIIITTHTATQAGPVFPLPEVNVPNPANPNARASLSSSLEKDSDLLPSQRIHHGLVVVHGHDQRQQQQQQRQVLFRSQQV